jgi:NAD(P)-dependent dehydrogenase (short-subunit alcohol dehydrogenase family)
MRSRPASWTRRWPSPSGRPGDQPLDPQPRADGAPGQPSELIGACLLLASEAGSFLTGQTLIVDGGAQAGGRWFHPDR